LKDNKDYLDTTLKKITTELNRTWSQKYVNSNDDLGYIKKAWNLISVIQEGIGYEGERMQPWSSVEQTVTDMYLDLISNDNNTDPSSKRIESLMRLYDGVLGYVRKKFDKEQTGDLKTYLIQYLKIGDSK
jgi:hypothetical protein